MGVAARASCHGSWKNLCLESDLSPWPPRYDLPHSLPAASCPYAPCFLLLDTQPPVSRTGDASLTLPVVCCLTPQARWVQRRDWVRGAITASPSPADGAKQSSAGVCAGDIPLASLLRDSRLVSACGASATSRLGRVISSFLPQCCGSPKCPHTQPPPTTTTKPSARTRR